MTGERTEKALARMDLALRRIAAGSVRAKAVLDARSRQLGEQSAQLEVLAKRNEHLRGAVTATLRDLDQLIQAELAVATQPDPAVPAGTAKTGGADAA